MTDPPASARGHRLRLTYPLQSDAWANALARQWVPQLPRTLRTGFLRLLYALACLARDDGRLREPDGTPITLEVISRAARLDEPYTRTYLSAALAAGVIAVGVVDDPHMYVLQLTPTPDWAAAQRTLTRR